MPEPFLPPYGLLSTSTNPSDSTPADWRGKQTFAAWRDSRIAFFADHLWPEWKGAWTGGAAANMVELTKVDIELINSLRATGPDRAIDGLPGSARRTLSSPSHRDLFKEEDDGPVRPGEALRHYDRSVSREVLEAMPLMFNRGITRKFTAGHIYSIKKRLQRPRPYQASLILDIPFDHDAAKSALHPAMISGHCVQGILMLMTFAERAQLDGFALPEEAWKPILQLCVDFGDRRVMSGVHYPSDNLSSWIVAFDLIKRTVDPAAQVVVKEKVWQAITEHSIVYRELAKSPEPYGKAWEELHNLAS